MYTYILTYGGDFLNLNGKSEYGELLTKLIKDKKMTQVDFYNKLGIKKPYFYDIIGGKINPPPPEIQLKILKIVNPNKKNRNKLLEIAANVRGEIPADILFYLANNQETIDIIRKQEDYKEVIGEMINGKEKNWNKKRIFRKNIKW